MRIGDVTGGCAGQLEEIITRFSERAEAVDASLVAAGKLIELAVATTHAPEAEPELAQRLEGWLRIDAENANIDHDAAAVFALIRENRNDESASAIVAATEEQGATTRKITCNVREAASGTVEESRHISSVSVAAGQTGRAEQDVRQASSSLKQGAASLNSSVAYYLDRLRVA